MRNVPHITKDEIKTALHLEANANTAASFERLGVDSWDLIEFRAVLENKFGMTFSDEDWVSMNCPDDVVRNTGARQHE